MYKYYCYNIKNDYIIKGNYIISFPDFPISLEITVDNKESIPLVAETLLSKLIRKYKDKELLLPIRIYKSKNKSYLFIQDYLKLYIIKLFKRSKLSKVKLGIYLNRSESEVRRILNINHNTKLDTLTEVLYFFNKKVVLEFKNL